MPKVYEEDYLVVCKIASRCPLVNGIFLTFVLVKDSYGIEIDPDISAWAKRI